MKIIFCVSRMMELRLARFLVLCCVILNTGWCMDQDTQSLVDRLERSTVTNFTTTTSNWVYHMEKDLFKPGHILYTDLYSLKTTDGTTSTTIAGNTTVRGYREGSEARFNYIYGFTQITYKRVAVADRYHHCLREINRHTGLTSVFSGQCQSRGYTDGLPGHFNYPYSVIRDNNDVDQLLVTDKNNNAVRTVDIHSASVGTFFKSETLKYIRHLTQDDNGDLYVIAANRALYRITYREKKTTLISGSPRNSGYTDSSLLDSLFGYSHDLVFIGFRTLLVADVDNNKIRLVDLDTDRVSTLDLCSGCLYRPYSLLITNSSLYVGQSKRIQQFVYPRLTTTPIPTTTTPSTTTLMATSRAPCQDKNMTLYVTSDGGRALIDTAPGQQTAFAVGSHIIYRDNCTINIVVKNNGTICKNEECPEVIRGVVSASTGFSALDLTLDGTTHTLELPVGVYNYRIKGRNTNCSLKVEIKDYLLVRRVDLVARYDNIKCTVLTETVALSTIKINADGNVNQIREICKHDCNPKVGSQAKFSCDNDTLTVTWSTDVTFDGTVTAIPKGLKKRLTDSLLEESRYPILDIVVISRIPPLVYPTKTKTGAYAELVLTSSCLHDKKYDKRTDSCV